MDFAGTQSTQTKHSEDDHNSDSQESTGLDIMQANEGLATLSISSHPAKDAVNTVLTTVSIGNNKKPVPY